MKTLINRGFTLDADISCRLPKTLIKRRKSTIIHELIEKIILTEEVEDGYCFTFNYSEELLFRLAEFVKLEKESCPFLDFKITATGNTSMISLSLGGPEGTKEFIKLELELA